MNVKRLIQNIVLLSLVETQIIDQEISVEALEEYIDFDVVNTEHIRFALNAIADSTKLFAVGGSVYAVERSGTNYIVRRSDPAYN